jgi:hypothetical protein
MPAPAQPLKRVAIETNTFVFPGLPKLNPGLKFANTFGVKLEAVPGLA